MHSATKHNRHGMTMIELLVVIALIAMMAAISMSALANLEQRVRIERTKTIIKRIDQAIMEKWESYQTRPLPLSMPGNISNSTAALIRLRAIKDLQRMELPERPSDVDTRYGSITPVNLAQGLKDNSGNNLNPMSLAAPSTFKRYVRIVANAPSGWGDDKTRQAECLYMILAGMRDAETNPLDFLAPSEIGDTDGDGMKEVLDAWGEPLYFWRWAPGYVRDFNPLTPGAGPNFPASGTDPNPDYRDVVTTQDRNTPDPFDPFKVDPQLTDSQPVLRPFSLRPLIVSSGPDKQLDLVFHFERTYADSANPPGNKNFQNNPFPSFTNAKIGEVIEAQPYDFDGDGWGWTDNITNHYIEAP